MEFTDRKSTNINKRRLKVLSSSNPALNNQTIDVEMRHFEEGVWQLGTPINANLFNSWESRIGIMEIVTNAVKDEIAKLLEQPDCADIDKIGSPSVCIDANGKFKFSNLKGAPGDKHAAVEIPGKHVFYVNDNDELCVKYNDSVAPSYEIIDGNLVYKFN